MGTRGIMGVRLGGHDKLMYNQFDTYPEGLGKDMIEAAADLLRDRPAFETLVRNLKPVQVDDNGHDLPPTAEQIEQLKPYTDLGVSEQSTSDWYCLLRKTQGDMKSALGAGWYQDSLPFAADSLFCEYGYIINLDDNVFEAYKGFQHSAHDNGRFAKMEIKKGREHPIALVGTIPLDDISKDPAAAFKTLVAMFGDDSEDEAA